jgi:hypothetical protein
MYTHTNFKTKKALKQAVADYNAYVKNPDAARTKVGVTGAVYVVLSAPRPVTVFQPGPFPGATNGSIALEGPHYPQAHTWYASAVIKDSVIVSIK